MQEQKIMQMVCDLAGAVCDRPFADETIVIFRHGAHGKWFGALLNAPRRALNSDGEGETRVLNVKCDPLLAAMLRETYPEVNAGYHMNKTHWISLVLEGGLPEEEFRKLLSLSYQLTLPKARRRDFD
jgi:hypothetical protein